MLNKIGQIAALVAAFSCGCASQSHKPHGLHRLDNSQESALAQLGETNEGIRNNKIIYCMPADTASTWHGATSIASMRATRKVLKAICGDSHAGKILGMSEEQVAVDDENFCARYEIGNVICE